MGFSGFPPGAVAFYEQLEGDNSKSFWKAHSDTYDRDVKAPMLALLDELEPEFGAAQLFRPYRDIRFSADKSPYKTHQGAFVAAEPGVGLYVQISADGLLAAGGFHSHAPDQVDRYRKAVDADRTGDQLAAIVADLGVAGFGIGGDRLKTRPRGYPAEHPRIELLRHRSLTAERHWSPEPWFDSAETLTRVRDTWRAMKPLCDWVSANVGPPRG